jgi:uncharacterized protein YqjF (DUF2071 family)
MLAYAVRMRWHDLLFAHWSFPPDAVRPLLPEGLELDTHDGLAWIGVVPFRMSDVHPRLLPPLPIASAFPEMNVRTYVRVGDRAGVWFFSLDAASRVAVWTARRWYGLPYRHARMEVSRSGGQIRYRSVRVSQPYRGVRLDLEYEPSGPARRAAPGGLDDFLTARFSLFSLDRRGSLRRADIVHDPWRLQPAKARIEANTMLDPLGLVPVGPPRLAFARTLHVLAGAPRPLG